MVTYRGHRYAISAPAPCTSRFGGHRGSWRRSNGECSCDGQQGHQRMTVLVDGETRYSWPVSTGMKGYATPAGTFRPFRLEEEHYSKEWDDAPMTHSIFFTPAGHAIHGSNATRRLGSPASHGCIRVFTGERRQAICAH